MTASDLPFGLQASELSLRLLADTNYYLSVNFNLADPVEYGRNRGCDFVTGVANPEP